MTDGINNDYRDYRRDYEKSAERARADKARPNATPRVEDKTPFEKVMERQQFPVSQNTSPTATREAVRPALSQEEKYGKQKESFEDKLKEKSEKKEGSDKKEGGRVRESQKKVVGRDESRGRGEKDSRGGKSSGGEGGHSGGQGGQGGEKGASAGNSGKGGQQGQSSRRDRGFLKPGAAAAESRAPRSAARTTFAPGIEKAAQTAAAPEAKPATRLSQAVIDEIVQYCRVLTRTDGDKEMELQLKETVFKGLRLRVRFRDGKMSATFITQSSDVKNLFQARKSDLVQTLEEKGIVVASLNVILP